MTLSFEDAETPTKARAENPFTDTVASMELGKAKKFTVSGDIDPAKNKDLARYRRQLTAAGDDAGVTVRTEYKATGTVKAPVVTVTFWTVTKITKTKKTPGITETVSA